jgi:hypothetical protein
VLATLRELVPEVKRLGECGLTITRFKGLGEMDGDELSETTLAPQRRTLLQVQLDDAVRADEMFRTLMGEKVEPRRDSIQKHALEVKDIDYHGAQLVDDSSVVNCADRSPALGPSGPALSSYGDNPAARSKNRLGNYLRTWPDRLPGAFPGLFSGF